MIVTPFPIIAPFLTLRLRPIVIGLMSLVPVQAPSAIFAVIPIMPILGIAVIVPLLAVLLPILIVVVVVRPQNARGWDS
jgi:hypothetical protein